ncbi:hypothetical protein DT73_13020 [Mangrovibacter sp. MFB070]|uniref:hypothetical protein n=1 Tax=Mangrovibacter sp. MFB070 TaxID=1224318 RepID=UPI0004D5B0CE|nr:hypothetical protein [Mangrovibacter sp. MFB070]KEA51850.1 hypothetical protein DT73_13020 [Mangrovibacter sp. MFB070]
MKIISDDFKVFSYWISKVLKENVYLRFLIYGVILICFILVLIRSYLSDSSNLAQWVSSISDFIMAISATIGVIVASKWRSDSTKDKVINIGVEIVSKKLKELRTRFYSQPHLKVFTSLLSNLLSTQDVNNIKINIFYNSFFSLNEVSNKDASLIKDIRSDIKMISTLGWNIKNNDFSILMLEIEQYSEQLITCLITIESVISMLGYRTDGTHVVAGFNIDGQYHDVLSSMNSNLKDLDSLREGVSKKISYYEDCSIFDLITPK